MGLSSDQCCGVTVASIICGIGLLLLVILTPLSFQRVDTDEAAISYDKVSRKLGTEPLDEGVHNVGPSGSLIKFKTTQRTADINNLVALTADGIPIELTIQIAYTVIVTDTRSIVDEFTDQEEHDAFLQLLCGTVIRDTAVGFSVRSFYLQREEFQSALQLAIAKSFTDDNVHAIMQIVQVVNIELGTTVEFSLGNTTIAEQDVSNAQTERAQSVQAAEIAKNLTAQESQLTILSAVRDVDKIDQESEQAVLAERNRILKRTYAFGNISLGLGEGGNFFVSSYLKSLVLQGNEGKTIIGL